MKNNWLASWPVTSMTTDKVYKVSMRVDGSWGCDCPAWKFHKAPKPDCKHILKVKDLEPVDRSKTPTIDRDIPRSSIRLPGEKRAGSTTFSEMNALRVAAKKIAAIDTCLCGAPMRNGVCSVRGCVASSKPTPTIQPQPYFVTQTRRAILLED